MKLNRKLAILADAAKYDASCASSGAAGRRAGASGLGSTTGSGICHSYTPDGRCVSLLKILLTNVCIFDCRYCVNRRSSDVPRARFTADQVVRLTLDFYRRNYIEGLFLSSGIIRSADYTMEQLVEVARALRQDHLFSGYIHLKTIPEASPELVAEAGRWADRLSINVELPTQGDLDRLAPEKDLVQIEGAMGRVGSKISDVRAERRKARGRRKPDRFVPAGQSTQMIVGATPATDREVLHTSDRLYSRYRLRRVYYSAFSPIPAASASLPLRSPPLLREHRLYQADWLLRFYGFDVDEITTPEAPSLPLDVDPKTAWALRHRSLFPVDVNRADRESLLRVPGLGTKGVSRILTSRRHRRLRLDDLVRLGVRLDKARHFIVTDDHRPRGLDAEGLRLRVAPRAFQTDLFEQSVIEPREDRHESPDAAEPPDLVSARATEAAAAVTGEL
ncbi:putative DNA modification/repair radical SAM protein [Gaopeijia maritima]|uniref:putative DNA modification/repair radical SAM protein n=1 Tax=Gaopeijia maritima TaxID=3119007 RepID=UPI00324AD85E